MTHYQIDIVSDSVCPWCYIGKKRIDLAIKQHQGKNPQDTFTTTWYPFYLQPNAPTKSVDKATLYASKFGAQRTQMMQSHMAQLGKQVGIDFKFGGRTGNTRDSHRLIRLGQTKGDDVQTRVVEELFNAYFENEEDITSQETLIKRGVKAGLPEDEVRDWLQTGKGGEEVDFEVQRAQYKAVSGVPNFTINGSFDLQGAQETAAFLRAFAEIKKTEGQSGRGVESGSGNTC